MGDDYDNYVHLRYKVRAYLVADPRWTDAFSAFPRCNPSPAFRSVSLVQQDFFCRWMRWWASRRHRTPRLNEPLSPDGIQSVTSAPRAGGQVAKHQLAQLLGAKGPPAGDFKEGLKLTEKANSVWWVSGGNLRKCQRTLFGIMCCKGWK